MFDPVHISRNDAVYPPALHLHLAESAPAELTARGDLTLLRTRPLVALFCSVQCSEAVILQTYELAQALCKAGVTIISGFHSPMEKECLRIFLQGEAPIIACPARSIERLRLPADWKAALAQRRLLLLSPFAEEQRQTTTRRAMARNACVAALADVVLVAYAASRGRLTRLCEQALAWDKPVLALQCEENAPLLAQGAKRVWIDHIRKGEAFAR